MYVIDFIINKDKIFNLIRFLILILEVNEDVFWIVRKMVFLDLVNVY